MIGRKVMVDPFLTNDPFDKRGQVASVIRNDRDSEVLVLKFDDDQVGLYAQDAARTLYPKTALLYALHAHRKSLPIEVYRAASMVFKLANQGDNENALKLAMSDERLADLCTLTCYDFIEMNEVLKERKQEKNKL